MCLIVFDWRPGSDTPLRLAANRDEIHARPTQALAPWPDAPTLVGGRDLRAGGTWLAASQKGRLAAVTNVRDAHAAAPTSPPSRGALPYQALTHAAPLDWLDALATHEARAYAWFNLLYCDGVTLIHVHHSPTGTTLTRVPPGVHGLSNATLDTSWPKVIRARDGFEQALTQTPWQDPAQALMRDTQTAPTPNLPNTGVGPEMERFLAPIFIRGQRYGTRATTLVEWRSTHIELQESRFGPNGVTQGSHRHSLALTGATTPS
ncbi:NRDE family protein [Chromohalobacter sp. HP20-39]|uniref:NRDE family protein n=1 Tax=Chromohalobacter sp. HP20-39 TaxID=3079306 RepID=UPI00294ABDAF|nr:NRDE family protein [Chromohalobacter sp. HP20-39]MDV6317531.1 NRDE family protein [Chromohalobacter sp. HP20-39]